MTIDAARARNLIASLILAVGLAVLVGWALNIATLKSVLPGLTTMKANTALSLALSAVALLLMDRRTTRASGIVALCTVLTASIAAATLAEYTAHLQLGIDQLLFADPATTSRPFSGRMSPATAVALLAGAGSLHLLRFGRSRRMVRTANRLALIPAGIGSVSLAGYAYGVEALYNFGPFVSVALHTGCALLLLAAAMFLVRSQEGWAYRLQDRPIAFAALLRIAGLALAVSFVAGLAVVWGMRVGFYQAQFTPSISAVTAAGGLLWLAFRSAHILAAAEGDLKQARGDFHRTSEALQLSRRRHQALLEELPQLVWTCQPDGSCDYLSRQWVDYTGIPEADQLGTDWLDRVIHPMDAERTRQHWIDAVAGRSPYDIDYRLRGKDGRYRWFKVRGLQLRDPDGRSYWFGTCTDIEEIVAARESLAASRRDLEATVEARTAELMSAEDQLRQSQKMEAVGQLTGGLAHDFNNLLTGITGSLEMLRTRLSQGRIGELDRYLQAAQGAAGRAAALTHRLLAFSRRQTLDARSTDANRLVAGMEDLIRRTVGPGIVLEVAGGIGLWSVMVDPHQLENALLNLAINARDAMPDGGRLSIQTANCRLDEPEARARELDPGQYVSLCVADTGCGMPPDVVARAFDPFFTTKPLGMGTGLGLSMIYGFARQSGGQARITSEPGRGSTVCLYLPRHLADAVEPESKQQLPAPHGRAGETILIIDDEPTICMLVSEVLRDLGYVTLEAGDGPSALEIIESGARIDLLVTDVGLPGGMDGWQLAAAARRARPGLLILFMTGFAESAVIGKTDLDAQMHVLAKPFAMEAMATRVTDLLAAAEPALAAAPAE